MPSPAHWPSTPEGSQETPRLSAGSSLMGEGQGQIQLPQAELPPRGGLPQGLFHLECPQLTKDLAAPVFMW